MDNAPRCDLCGELLQFVNDFAAVFMLKCNRCSQFWFQLTGQASNDPAEVYVRSLIRKERSTEPLEPASWVEFREAGLLWWVNRALHLFGWAIVYKIESDGSISSVYPARCRFRGFAQDCEGAGFIKLTSHLKNNIDRLVADCEWQGDEVSNDPEDEGKVKNA